MIATGLGSAASASGGVAAGLPASVELPLPAVAGEHVDQLPLRLPDAEPDEPRFVPGELVVKLAEGADVDAVAAAHGLEVARKTRSWWLLRTAEPDTEAVRDRLAEDPAVADVQLNHIREAMTIPNDPEWISQEGAFDQIRLERAWDRAPTKGSGVRVAVLDTGVNTHADFAPGQVVFGYNAIDDSNDVFDNNGHGTRVAGVIASRWNNGVGTAGIAGQATIVPVKVGNAEGDADDFTIVAGIEWAIDTWQVDVINISYAGFDDAFFLADAVLYASDNDAVVVAAAGNGGRRTQTYPAALPGVLAVGAVDSVGVAPSWSNRGSWMGVSAPGVGIRTTHNGTTFANSQGTSFATAVVTGIVALLRASEPGLTAEQVTLRIRSTARDRGPAGHDPSYGSGVVDALAALGGPLPAPAPSPITPDLNDIYGPNTSTIPNATNLNTLLTIPTTNNAPATTSVGAPLELNPENDEDWYILQPSVASTWTITVTPPANHADGRVMQPVLEVYSNPGGVARSLLARATAGAPGQPVTVTGVKFSATPNRLRITNALNSVSPGLYRITITRTATGPLPTQDKDVERAWVAWGLAGSTIISNNQRNVAGSDTVGVNLGALIDFEFQDDDIFDFDLVDRHGTVLAGYRTTGFTWSAPVFDEASFCEGSQGATLNPPGSSLAAGPYTMRIRNMEDTCSFELLEDWSFNFVVGDTYGTDQTPPTISLSAPSSTTSATPSFTFSATGGAVAFECRVDGGAFAPCTSPHTVTVPQGTHVFNLIARDATGNESTATRVWTYSTSPTTTAATTTTAAPTTTTTKPPATTTTPTTIAAPPPTPSGYWMVGGTGTVYPFGQVPFLGSASSPGVVDIEPTANGQGYWVLNSAGQVFAFGNAPWHGNGSAAGFLPGEVYTAMSATPTGNGYWLFTNRGRVVSRGAAQNFGGVTHLPLNGPVLGSVATPTGNGYYMVASDGGIFAFGDAQFFGSMGGRPLNAPVNGLVPTSNNGGYWLVASDGGIFAFGNAPFQGSMGGTPLNRPVIGMVRYGNGYLMVGSDGGIFNFSDKAFFGSLGGNPPAIPIVAVAAIG